ncbi:class I SAM-dependent methyltransferase [Candidatus Poribacteria bacterium]|nr:class I SAM-dependent methyltransferase [Candidatus Poribacteria bacterium]
MIPARWRHMMLIRVLRRAAASALDNNKASGDGEDSIRSVVELVDELRTIVARVESTVSGKEGRSAVIPIMKSLLSLDNELYKAISVGACKYDNGIHPKHRLMKYHEFFCKNVGTEDTVLDIGCGNGFLTSDVAKCTSGRVVGIDMNRGNIDFAKKHYHADNIEYIYGDVNTDIKPGHFDIVILSNVLEHLSNRVGFLRQVREKVSPSEFLLRVPMYEREWMVPLKQELGIDYLLDATHEIEYTQEQFFEELKAAGLVPEAWEIRWGEIWCCATPE